MSWFNPIKKLPPIGEHLLFVVDSSTFLESHVPKGSFTCVGFFDGKDFIMVDAPDHLQVVLAADSVLLWKHMDEPPVRWALVRQLAFIYRLISYGFPAYICLILLLGWNSYVLKQDLYKQEVVTKTLMRYDQQTQIISRTLQIAYRINPDMADMCATIYQADARRYGVEWFWFGAMTRIESNFNTVALSPSDAKGLMQLLESTAAGLCKKMGLKYVKNMTVWEAPTNLRLGNAYIAEGLKEGKKQKLSDPMEYAVKRFLGGSKFKSFPDQELIETYYKNVLSEYETLRYIYKGVSLDYNL